MIFHGGIFVKGFFFRGIFQPFFGSSKQFSGTRVDFLSDAIVEKASKALRHNTKAPLNPSSPDGKTIYHQFNPKRSPAGPDRVESKR